MSVEHVGSGDVWQFGSHIAAEFSIKD